MPSTTKHCCRCKTTKPLDEFYKGNCANGRQGYCKACAVAYAKERYRKNPARFAENGRRWRADNHRHYLDHKLQKRYGITIEDLEARLKKQGNICAICKTDTPHYDKRGWHVDHDHKTGKFRGALCNKCNRGLGYFGDNPAVVRAAAAYLEQAQLDAH